MTTPERPGAPADVTFVGHATVLLEVDGLRILTDPVLTDRLGVLRRVVGSVAPATGAGLDLILVSHLHHDHLHLASLRRLDRRVPVVVPAGGADLVRRAGFVDIVEVRPGDEVRVGPVTVRAVPAVHDAGRWLSRRQATPVGYLVRGTGWGGYFAGDTDLFDDMASLSTEPLDLALLPVWGWGPRLGHGHLDPARAAEAADLIRVTTVVPIHWGTLWPTGLGRLGADRRTAPPWELAAAVERLGIPTAVQVLWPGSSTDRAGGAPPRPDRQEAR